LDINPQIQKRREWKRGTRHEDASGEGIALRETANMSRRWGKG